MKHIFLTPEKMFRTDPNNYSGMLLSLLLSNDWNAKKTDIWKFFCIVRKRKAKCLPSKIASLKN